MITTTRDLIVRGVDLYVSALGRAMDIVFGLVFAGFDFGMAVVDRYGKSPLGILIAFPVGCAAIFGAAIALIAGVCLLVASIFIVVGIPLALYTLPFLWLERAVFRDIASSQAQAEWLMVITWFAIPVAVVLGAWLAWVKRYYFDGRRAF